MFIFTTETKHLTGKDAPTLIHFPDDDPEPGSAAAWVAKKIYCKISSNDHD